MTQIFLSKIIKYLFILLTQKLYLSENFTFLTVNNPTPLPVGNSPESSATKWFVHLWNQVITGASVRRMKKHFPIPSTVQMNYSVSHIPHCKLQPTSPVFCYVTPFPHMSQQDLHDIELLYDHGHSACVLSQK